MVFRQLSWSMVKKMIDMFENIELGLMPKTVYEIDDDFFLKNLNECEGAADTS